MIPVKLTRLPGRVGVGISMVTGVLAMSIVAGPQMLAALSLPWTEVVRFLAIGTFQFALGCALYYESIQCGSISIAVPVSRGKVVLIFLLSIALGLDHFTWPLLGACLLVMLGGILVGWRRRADAPVGKPDGHRRSLVLSAIACVCWAIGETLIGTLPKSVPALASNGLMLCAGVVVYGVYALLSGLWREFRSVQGRDIACYAAHGVISFSLAYGLFVKAVGLSSPAPIVCLTSTYPLLSALIGWAAFRERPTANIITGACLLVGGVILLQLVK